MPCTAGSSPELLSEITGGVTARLSKLVEQWLKTGWKQPPRETFSCVRHRVKHQPKDTQPQNTGEKGYHTKKISVLSLRETR